MEHLLLVTLVAAFLTALATGLGAVPFFFVHRLSGLWQARTAAFAGGMMLSASVFSLAGEALNRGAPWQLSLGIVAGAFFLSIISKYLEKTNWVLSGLGREDSKKGILLLLAMSIHSFPEGIAVGVGFGTGDLEFGLLVTLAIAVHNIPEGLAISLPLRARGVSVIRCAWYSILSSLPQPLAALPAVVAVAVFEKLLPVGLGFAAGAMIYLVVAELLPEGFGKSGGGPEDTAWWLILGVVVMLLLAGFL